MATVMAIAIPEVEVLAEETPVVETLEVEMGTGTAAVEVEIATMVEVEMVMETAAAVEATIIAQGAEGITIRRMEDRLPLMAARPTPTFPTLRAAKPTALLPPTTTPPLAAPLPRM
jgi:hypothetical protein